MSQLYNSDIKERYLNDYENAATQHAMKSVFKSSYPIEKQLEKDLYSFSLDEIKDVIFNLNGSTRNSIKSSANFIKYYIDWAAKNSLRGNINPLRYVQPEWYDQFIDKNKKILFSEEEINEMIKNLVNAQDSVILQLVFFEGLEGDGLSELLNLKRSDVDFDNNTLYIADRKTKITASDTTMKLINEALKENTYQFKNGESQGFRKEAELLDNGYIIRAVLGKTINTEQADKHLVYRRLANVSEFFNYKYLNVKNVSKSGMIMMARDLYIRDNQLENKQLDEIAVKFNVNTIQNGKHTYFNYTLLKDIANMENLQRLYPEIFEL